MKTNKEYPATHSMSTAWFAADEDGNVAIVHFGENGPVPECISGAQDAVEEIVYQTFVETKDTCPCRILNLTDQQALEFYDKSLKKPERYDDLICGVVVKIKKEMENTFFDEISKMDVWKEVTCLSQNLGLYFIDYINEPTTKLYESIEDLHFLDLYVNDMFNRTDSYSAIEFNKFPFYIYAQPYNREIPITRLIKPHNPVKVSQLPENIKDKIDTLPLRFSETDTFQIADYFISDWSMWDDDEQIDIPFKSSNGESLRFTYYKLSDGKDSYSFYLNSSPLAEEENLYYSQCSYYCTVLSLTIPGSQIKNINCKQGNFAAMRVLALDAKSEKLYLEEREAYFRNMSEDEQNAKFQKDGIDKVVGFLNPYLLIIDDDMLRIFEKHYSITNNEIVINNQNYPFFLVSEIDAHIDQIMECANKEYRGIKIPIKLTENELQKLKTSVD